MAGQLRMSLVLLVASTLATASFMPALVVALRRGGRFVHNYRGLRVLRPLGLVLPAALTAGIVTWLALIGVAPKPRLCAATLLLAWAFALLGYLDDTYGDRSVGGLRGHLAQLRRGRVTTGLVKAGGGLLAGLAVAWLLGLSGARLPLAGVLIALFANIVNLLDLRPGRALKAFFILAAVALLLSPSGPAWAVWPAVLPPALVLFVLDLREVGMLGDTGSNALGALLGLTFVVNFSWQVQLLGVSLLAAATLASERYSFSEAIERNFALKWLDSLGRRSTVGPQGGTREH